MELSKVLLIVYLGLLLTHNDLVTYRVTDFIDDNRPVQYILVFLLIMALLSITNQCNLKKLIISSAISTLLIGSMLKVDRDWAIILCIMLIAGFVINYRYKCQQNHLRNNQVIDEEKRMEIVKNNQRTMKYFYMVLVIAIAFGVGIYYVKKTNQYGDEFDIMKFVGFSKK